MERMIHSHLESFALTVRDHADVLPDTDGFKNPDHVLPIYVAEGSSLVLQFFNLKKMVHSPPPVEVELAWECFWVPKQTTEGTTSPKLSLQQRWKGLRERRRSMEQLKPTGGGGADLIELRYNYNERINVGVYYHLEYDPKTKRNRVKVMQIHLVVQQYTYALETMGIGIVPKTF